MKNRARSPYLFCLIALPLVILTTVTLRSIALLSSYEPDIGRYANQTLSLVNGILLAATAGILAILGHEMKEMLAFKPSYHDLPSLFSGIFAAIALILFGITLPLGAIGESAYAVGLAFFSGLMAIAGAALFILRAFDGRARSGLLAVLNLPLAVLGISYPLYLSFGSDFRINDPAVTMATVAWVLIAFFFLGEARIALDRTLWALHTYITVLAAIASATLAIPNLIYHPIKGEAILGNSELDFVALAIFLYTLARLLSIFRTITHEATDTARFAMGMAKESDDTDIK